MCSYDMLDFVVSAVLIFCRFSLFLTDLFSRFLTDILQMSKQKDSKNRTLFFLIILSLILRILLKYPCAIELNVINELGKYTPQNN